MSGESKVEDGTVAVGVAIDAPPAKIQRHINDSHVAAVTVFTDRAEVTRRLAVEVEEAGLVDVEIEGFTKYLMQESLRVKGAGSFTILEVQYHEETKTISSGMDASESKKAANEANEELVVLKDNRSINRCARDVVQKRIQLVNSYATSAMDRISRVGAAETVAPAMDIDSVTKLMEYQSEQLTKSNEELHQLMLEDRKLAEQQSDLEKKISSLGHVPGDRFEQSHNVTVSLEVSKPGSIEIDVTYQTSHASWHPSYDVRISSDSQELSLSYFGKVEQSTGEDWTGTRLVLSTAKPAIGGTAPVLPTRTVFFASTHYGTMKRRSRTSRRSAPMQEMAHTRMLNVQSEAFSMSAALDEEDDEPAPVASTATAEVGGGASSATFTISRPSSVKSDGKPHKVTIAILTLKSQFRYYAAPALNPAAYLQAETKNSSAFPFLDSDEVNVFLDGSFVSTSELKYTSPGETFRSFLGTDAGIKIDYRPVKKFSKAKGMWSKSSEVTYEHVCIIKNTKRFDATVVIADILPRSSDSRIKVTPLEPSQEMLDAGAEDADDTEAAGAGGDTAAESVRQVKVSNNIVWKRFVRAGEKDKVSFIYSIEHPAEQPVSIA